MNAFRLIRERLGVSQAVIAGALDVSQSNISFYEKGQTVPPPVAAKLIEFAKAGGLGLTYDMVYGAAPLPAEASPPAAPTPLGEHATAAHRTSHTHRDGPSAEREGR